MQLPLGEKNDLQILEVVEKQLYYSLCWSAQILNCLQLHIEPGSCVSSLKTPPQIKAISQGKLIGDGL